MVKVNENYLLFFNNYIFFEIDNRVDQFLKKKPKQLLFT